MQVIAPTEPGAFADPGRFALLRALASQTTLALERCRHAEDASRARIEAETERTRSALLSSVSHDLRTPLAAIAGAASSLGAVNATALPESVRRDLALSIWNTAAASVQVKPHIFNVSTSEGFRLGR